MRSRRFAPCVALAVLLLACSGEEEDPDAPEHGTGIWAECPQSVAGDSVLCARTTGSADLFVRAADDTFSQRALVFDPGGPGIDPARLIEDVATTLGEEVLAAYDVIGAVPGPPDLEDHGACETAVRQALDDGLEVGALSGGPLTSACATEPRPTRNAVAALEALRIEGAYRALAFVTVSYGSTTALTYAATHPETTGPLVLDSPVDPAASWAERTSVAASELEAAAIAAGAGACSRTAHWCREGTDLEALARAVMASSAPGRGLRQIGLDSLLRRWPTTSDLLQQVVQDPSLRLLEDVAAGLLGDVGNVASATALRAAVECADLPSRPTAAQARARLEDQASAMRHVGELAIALELGCVRSDPSDPSDPPDPPNPSEDRVAVPATATSVLILTADPDHVTGAAAARALAARLGADLVVVPGPAHGVLAAPEAVGPARRLLTSIGGSGSPPSLDAVGEVSR